MLHVLVLHDYSSGWVLGSHPTHEKSKAPLVLAHPAPTFQSSCFHVLPCCLCAPPDVDSGYYTVKFDSLLLKEAVVEGDSILPPLRTEPAGSSDSDGSDADDPSYARGMAAATPKRLSAGRAHTVVSTRMHSRGDEGV